MVLILMAAFPSVAHASEWSLWVYCLFWLIAIIYNILPFILAGIALYYLIRYRIRRKKKYKYRLSFVLVFLVAIIAFHVVQYARTLIELRDREQYLVDHPEIARLNQQAAEDLARLGAKLKAGIPPAGVGKKVSLSSLPKGTTPQPIYGDYTPVTSLGEKAIREQYGTPSLSAKTASELHDMGIQQYRSRQFLGAIATWLIELDKRPGDAVVFTNIGMSFLRAGDIQRGIEYAKKASATDPAYGRALYILALGHMQTGDMQTTLHLLNIAEARGWIHDDLYHVRGLAYEGLGKPYSAREEFKKMKLDPTKTDILGQPVNRPELWGSGPDDFIVSEERANKISATRGAAKAHQPADVNLYNETIMKDTYGKTAYAAMSAAELHKIGLEHYRKRDYAASVAAWLFEADKDRRNSNTLNNIAIAYTAFLAYDMGLEYGKKALEIDPHFGHAHASLGRTYLLMNKHKEALYHFRQAATNGWNTPDSNFNIGMTFDALGKKEEARHAYERVKKMAPNYPGLDERLREDR